MNKELKVGMIVFIVTAIIFTGVGIYAETKITADKVTYSGTTTVKDKIDSLYTTQNTTVSSLNSQLTSLQAEISTKDSTILELQNRLGDLSSKDCISSSFVCTTCTTDEGQKIVDFNPSMFIIFFSSGTFHYYNKNISTTKFSNYNSVTNVYNSENELSSRYNINNGLIYHNCPSSYQDKTINYIACK